MLAGFAAICHGARRFTQTAQYALIEEYNFNSLILLKGSWDLVTRVIIRVTILITPIKVLITLLTKSHDPPSMVYDLYSVIQGDWALWARAALAVAFLT